MNYENVYFRVHYHHENVPDWIKPFIEKVFMKRRNLAARALNESGIYQKINDEWDREIGENAMLGPYAEDINPRYEVFVNKRVQEFLDEKINKKTVFRMVSGRYCDLEMRVLGVNNSRTWIDLEKID